jgi:hypothetical protein
MPSPTEPVKPNRPGPTTPTSPNQPVVPPDDPSAPHVGREPSIDPPPTVPPVKAPSDNPVVTDPPAPRACLPADVPAFPCGPWLSGGGGGMDAVWLGVHCA